MRTADVPEEFLECRTLAHAWKTRSTKFDHRHKFYERVMACIRCQVIKYQQLDQYGYIVSNRYDYPQGYLSQTGRVTAADNAAMRLASIAHESPVIAKTAVKATRRLKVAGA